jgi:hypothetical protein
MWEHRDEGNRVITFSQQDLVDFFLQGLTAVDGGQREILLGLQDFLRHIKGSPKGPRYTETHEGQVYGLSFHLYTYACLHPPESSLEDDEIDEIEEEDLFASPAERIVYELATCTKLSDPVYQPHPAYLSQLWDQHVLAFWANWLGLALKDNVVFLGVDDSSFNRVVLPHNAENDYFQLFLFVLFQKMRLSMMSGELIRKEVRIARDRKEAESLWNAFIEFQNHSWFVEVARSSQGMELYRRFQQGLGVLPLYEEIKEEVKELRDHYERTFERSVTRLLNFLTYILLPAGILAQLFGDKLFPDLSRKTIIVIIIAVYAFFSLMWFFRDSIGRK